MRPILKRILLPIDRFLHLEASSGILLAAATVLAMGVANSPWSEAYFQVLHAKVAGLSVHHWINDGLMTIFFFLVGMEIKREMVRGELSSPRQAALPIAGAIGGMVGPALVYYFLNPQMPEARGWGIPMATDIAFAVGVLAFFGRRVPLPLKVFLLALAIVDDLGAVMVIAFFYTQEILGPFLGLAALTLGVMMLLKRAGLRAYSVYIALGALAWFAVLKSGVHATVAGVMIGLLTPLEFPGAEGKPYSPLEDLVHKLHPWVGFGIMPVFALANAGVSLSGGQGLGESTIFLGVTLGLFAGKPLGILVACALAVAFGLAQLPRRVGWASMVGVGFLGGIGFTMALFISSLALFPEQEFYSKMGILLGSFAAALCGALTLAFSLPKASAEDQ